MKKKQIVKRMMAGTLVLGLMAGTLTGCGNGKSGSASSEPDGYSTGKFVTKEVTEGVKLTVAIPSSSKVEDYETNDMTLTIEKELGVDLEFVVLPSADYAAKLNVMVMSGDELPDIIFNPSGWESWIEEGVLVDLTDYYKNEDYSANIRQGSERCEIDLIDYMTRPDGSQYAVPSITQELYAPVQQKLWIYQPWLDALGLDVPETIEEYYEACKLVVANDMNGNGKKDEIGLTGTNLDEWFDCMMSSFVYAHEGNWRVVEDGKTSFAFTTDAWKEGVKYIRKFFAEGLIPEETLTQSDDQYKSVYYASTPTVFSFADWNYTGTDTKRRGEYTAIPALEGPEGVKYSCNIATIPTAGAVITNDCKTPLAAFLVCDYMCNQDMSITQRFGKQGEDWDYWDVAKEKYDESEFVPTFEGYDISFYPYDLMGFWDSTEAQNKSYRKIGPMILDKNTLSGAAVWSESGDSTKRGLAALELATAEAAIKCYEYQPKEVYDFAPLTVKETDKVADVKIAVISYVEEMTAAFLTGKKDIDAEWSNYLKELEQIGMNEYLEVLQEAYERVH